MLQCIKGVYFDGSNTANRILDVLEEERSRIICIDELDKFVIVNARKAAVIGKFLKGQNHTIFQTVV